MRPDHPAVELGMVAILPALLLSWGTESLGTTATLVAALALPLAHAGWSAAVALRPSPFLPFVLLGTGATAGVGLLDLSPTWFAAKEGLLPLGMAAMVVASDRGSQPILPALLDRTLHLSEALTTATAEQVQAVGVILRRGSRQFAATLVASGLASAVLAVALVRSAAATQAFNEELGRYTATSWPAITLPTSAVTAWVFYRVVTAIERTLGRELGAPAVKSGP